MIERVPMGDASTNGVPGWRTRYRRTDRPAEAEPSGPYAALLAPVSRLRTRLQEMQAEVAELEEDLARLAAAEAEEEAEGGATW